MAVGLAVGTFRLTRLSNNRLQYTNTHARTHPRMHTRTHIHTHEGGCEEDTDISDVHGGVERVEQPMQYA